MWIERAVTPRLLEASAHFPVVLLTGARQTGKTSLLQHAFPGARFVGLDLPSVAESAETSPGELLGDGAGPVLIDEVQYAPGIFRHLKAAVDRDRHRMGRFLLTGSQRFPLMQAVSESLAGRVAVLELSTLSAAEIRAALGEATPDAPSLLYRGGYPELYRDAGAPIRAFVSSYVVTYLERDVRSLLRVGNLRDFERFLRACALRTGGLLNLTDLARDVGISGTTARDWLSVLETSGIVTLVEPWLSNHGSRLVKTPKLYFRDTGLVSFLLGIDGSDAVDRSPFAGPLWETFVLHQMTAAIASAGSAARVCFYRDAHGLEVDFALEHDGRVRLVEAKWGEEAHERDFAALVKVRERLGKRAADEHWLVCRTPHPRKLRRDVGLRFVNGATWTRWVS